MIDQIKRKQLQKKYGNDQVFIVPFVAVAGIADGFTRAKHDPSIWTKFDGVGKFALRGDVEEEPAFQQIIPYILIKHPSENKYYVSKRLKGEQRLVDQISLGFGGHIEPQDGVREVLFKALVRELLEEVYIEPTSNAEFVGYVRGLKSATNDHLGCVFVVKAETASVREKDNLEGEWMTVDQLEKNYFKFENWAKSIIDYLVVNDKKF